MKCSLTSRDYEVRRFSLKINAIIYIVHAQKEHSPKRMIDKINIGNDVERSPKLLYYCKFLCSLISLVCRSLGAIAKKSKEALLLVFGFASIYLRG
jgi:hypothetical protein